jgi:flagellar basal-body rod protein FlgG
MIDGLDKAASALGNGFNNMGVIANNLANINTTGFKKDLPFSEVLSEENGIILQQFTDHKQGDILYTNNPLDVALSGEGFFTLETEGGTRFTKNGKFQISDDGFLVTTQGYKVMGESGEINLEEYMSEQDQDITITKEGDLIFGKNHVDKLLISKVDDINDLKKVEGSCFILEEGGSFQAEEDEYAIQQGYLESSNVNPVIEMEAMIQQTKDYETASKIIQALDTSLKDANEIGKV